MEFVMLIINYISMQTVENFHVWGNSYADKVYFEKNSR